MTLKSQVYFSVIALMLCAIAAVVSHSKSAVADQVLEDGSIKMRLIVNGGHDTVGVDRGRPVILIANALGVPPEVFREAFTHVHPAPPGQGPTEQEARDNKRALLDALGKYGVTNDRLDEVSNYYRYVRSRGEMWPTNDAEVYALVKGGKVTSFVVTAGGSGYSSVPTLTMQDGRTLNAELQLSFSKVFEENGAIGTIQVPAAK